jgi:hypothetical protein
VLEWGGETAENGPWRVIPAIGLGVGIFTVITCFTLDLMNSSRALSENREFSLFHRPLPGLPDRKCRRYSNMYRTVVMGK